MWIAMIADGGATTVARPQMFDRLEEFFSLQHGPQALQREYEWVLKCIERNGAEDWRRLAMSLGASDQDLDHFDADWLGHETIVDGFLAALRDALDGPLPLKVEPKIGEQVEVSHRVEDKFMVVTLTAPAAMKSQS